MFRFLFRSRIGDKAAVRRMRKLVVRVRSQALNIQEAADVVRYSRDGTKDFLDWTIKYLTEALAELKEIRRRL